MPRSSSRSRPIVPHRRCVASCPVAVLFWWGSLLSVLGAVSPAFVAARSMRLPAAAPTALDTASNQAPSGAAFPIGATPRPNPARSRRSSRAGRRFPDRYPPTSVVPPTRSGNAPPAGPGPGLSSKLIQPEGLLTRSAHAGAVHWDHRPGRPTALEPPGAPRTPPSRRLRGTLGRFRSPAIRCRGTRGDELRRLSPAPRC